MRPALCSLLLAATTMVATAPSAPAQTVTASDKVEVTVHFPMDKPRAYPELLRDGRVVTAMRDGKVWRVMVNGTAVGPASLEMPALTFSRDQRHYAVYVFSEGKSLVIFDDSVHALPLGSMRPLLHFSADGRAVAFRACQALKGGVLVCRTGLVGQAPDSAITHWPIALAGGDRPAIRSYVAARGDKFVVALNGKDTPESVALSLTGAGSKNAFVPYAGLTLAPGGRRLGYVAWGSLPLRDSTGATTGKVENAVAVVVDDRVGEPFSMVGPIVFSPDGSRYAHAAIDNRAHRWKWDSSVRLGRVIVDGVAGPSYEVSGTLPSRPTMPPGDLPLILHGLSADWAGISNPVFSPDSKRVAYLARRGKDDFAVILDGTAMAVPKLERVLGDPVFSPDSRHVAFVGYANRTAQLYVDGAPIGEAIEARAESRAEALTFDPTSRRVAFVLAAEAPAPFQEPFPGWFGSTTEEARVAQTVGGEMVHRSTRRFVIDGRAGPPFTSFPIREVYFSPNGEHVAHIMDYKGVVVVRDGTASPTFRRFYPFTFAIDNDGVATYMAGDDRGIVKVRQGGR